MLALLILSVGLAMDAFAVALVRGSLGEKSWLRAAEVGLAFGAAQGLMPLLGWSLGWTLGDLFKAADHWVAFLLLLVLGIKMIREAFSVEEAKERPTPRFHIIALATAAFATSIDAAAAGLTLPVLGLEVPLACFTIGITTALLCAAGYWLGSRVSYTFGKRAELAGGLILIGLGTRILIEHLTA